jgi:ABC-type branched-subunit amino acid transport system substrate-binding protein
MCAIGSLAVSITLSACGSSDNSADPGSSGGAATGSTKPIKLMLVGQLQAAAFAFPDMEDGAKAAAATINAAGGIKGRKVEVTACNDAGDPNKAAACARDAVSGKYTALVGGVSLYYNNIFPILDAAGIPMIAASPLNSAAQQSSLSFPVDSNSAQFTASGIALVKYKKCKNVAVIYNSNATATLSGHEVSNGVKWAGGTVTKEISVPDTAPDLSAVVSTALDSGADCIGTALGPAALVKMVTALRASSKPTAPVASTIGSIPLAIVKPLGAAAEGIIATNNAYTPESDVWKDARAAMTKQNPSVTIENFGVLAYSSVETFAEVAKTIDGNIDAKSVAAAAAKQSAIKPVGYPSAVDWTKPGPLKDAPRLFNTSALLYEIKNGAYSLTSQDAVDAAEALAAS